ASDIQSMIHKTVEKYGRLDIAFNNAGVEGVWMPISDQTEENWDYVHNINLKGLFFCLKYEIQQMLKQGHGGAIVNFSSAAGLMDSEGSGIYVARNHGVIALTGVAAIGCAPAKIRVTAVCPAVIETPMADRAFADPEANKRVLGMHPLGRFGKPIEVAEAVFWLCSDKSSFTTGQYIAIDGGLLTAPYPVG